VVESGRYVASSCGTYVSSVMDLKQNAEVPALFIDGGINHLNYYGQIMGMKKPPIHLVKTNSSQSIQGISTGNGYTIYGSLCTTADIITKEYPFESQPGVGDLLSFANIGAYSVTEGIYLFLSHPLPKILSFKNGTEKLLRDSVESWQLNTSGGICK
ncbi:MAG: diaminopimelate decarboxylase, partial [Treponema sp.]|nr:diaminopimelate decarboxylase [Treponema sp.]